MVERSISFEQAIDQAVEYLENSNKAVGVELDLDSISFMPASAIYQRRLDPLPMHFIMFIALQVLSSVVTYI